MTAYVPFAALPHLDPIFAGIRGLDIADAEARALAIDPRRSLLLLAPAGSGKTSTLQMRLLSCLTVVERPEEVLAITFTNLAAAEIIERVLGALQQAATGVEPTLEHELPQYRLARLVLERDKEMGWNLLLNPSRLRIMTFDSFCASLASKTPIMSGLGGGKTTDDASMIYHQAIMETLKSVNDNDIPEALAEALEAVLRFSKNRFETLAPMFADLLTKRDQWAGRIMTLDPAAMQEAVSSAVLQAAQSAIALIPGSDLERAMNCLQAASAALEGFDWAATKPQFVASPDAMSYYGAFASYMLTGTGTVRAKVNVSNGFPAKHPCTVEMNDILADIKAGGSSGAFAQALGVLSCLPDLEYPARAAKMVEHFTVILRYLLANLTLAMEATNSLDFPEIAQRAIQALGAGETVSEALLEEDRILHIMVDEFQDTNQAQYDLLKLLVENWEMADNRSIAFVGDGFQSIYLFRGADLNLFTSVVAAKAFGPKEMEVLRLTVNFRSLPGVVSWNNDTYAQVFKDSAYEFVPSVPFRKGEGGVEVHPIAEGALGEAAAVTEVITDALAKDPSKSIAILVRGRSHLKRILPMLKDAGIEVRGKDIDPIGEAAPVSEVIALIRAFWHPADRSAWVTLLRASFVGLSWADCLKIAQGHKVIGHALRDEAVQAQTSPEGQARIQRLLAVLDGVQRSSRGSELAWAVKSAWIALGGPATVDRGQMDDVETIFKLLTAHTETGDLVDPQAFFRAIDKAYASPKAGAVTVMTLHGSKGLEFDIVLIPGLNKGGAKDDQPLFYFRQMEGVFTVVPNLGDLDPTTPESRLFKFVGGMVRKDVAAEVCRAAYVGTTRARENCHLFVCVDRFPAAEGEEQKDKEIKPVSGSLAECLWPAIGPEVKAVEPAFPIVADKVSGVPSKARLAPDFTVELPKSVFIPAASNDQIPTENELNDELREEEGTDYRAKTIGIVYHWFVEQIGKQGVDLWNEERVRTKAQAIASLLRREGYPTAEVPSAVARIIRLLVNTVNSKHGQWILKKRPGSGHEVQVSAYRNGRWVHRFLDRPFEEDGVYWISDYKTPDCPEGMSEDAFVAREVERYRMKMEEYGVAVRDAGVTLPVKKVLYFPAFDRLAEVA
ncbi:MULTISPECIES: UvrD-helicase domain-containing protein [Pseudomonas]|uniref:UvrD-helicase domain-containing protein n=1 Tax=Pseudomonas TaxID=286 RepID=UPI000C7B8610|nr:MULTISPECIES: UvrD-helicase domain-containing protein [Pseudomonas]MCT8162733.1 UvrD-helicase domain-containing protein [Pseudomonas sp. HD6422]MCT8181498.1 UvrD-helicase domain-containing protein [Pseudomonas sp. HD6421]PLP85976.1 DNA helicase UvrD [Pseudomonas sp. FFUP_PS_41]QDQ70150.1 DNA helicase UvrD [Pseudomonas sp.]